MKNVSKYKRQFFDIPKGDMNWATKDYVNNVPIWCSVDLRDGNQSLIVPMSLDEKLEYFNLLLDIGFKEIEVGFPAASDTEFAFLRTLIEKNLVPKDVKLQVLTQSRKHIIEKTFEALKGCENAIVHLYNSTSFAQRQQVFKKSKEEIIDIAIEGAKLFKEIEEKTGVKYTYEYSPESFTGTEPEFSLEICNKVLDIWKPTKDRKAIINLPATMELSSPHIYANYVEYMNNNLNYRENVIISLHPHNDRGCAIADAELGLLAGADRVEGTLFGNGERTGNADIITLALNMYSQGINPHLDLSDIPKITESYEQLTGMSVHERHPYSGKLVFAAFSGSHQDAIAKGVKWHEETGAKIWNVPYLPIDPKDIGREYKTDVIRINSQSGKGGIGYLLENSFGIVLPSKMREDVGYLIKSVSDMAHAELNASQVYDIFTENYVNVNEPIKLVDYHFTRSEDIFVSIILEKDSRQFEISSRGNGRLDAVSNAIKDKLGFDFSNLTYEEHALEQGSSSKAITYVSIKLPDGKKVWGAGIHDDIIASSVNALFSAVNRSVKGRL